MTTVNKDFRVKHGLVVEGSNATVNGSNVLTEASTTFLDNKIEDVAGNLLENATLSNIQITYDNATNALVISAENGVADSTTDNLTEGTTNKYFTNQRAIDAVGGSATSDNTPSTVVKRDASGNFAAGTITADVTGQVSDISNHTTNDLTEGTGLGANLYFTVERAMDAISAGDGLDYDAATGIMDIDPGNGLQIGISNEIEIDTAITADLSTAQILTNKTIEDAVLKDRISFTNNSDTETMYIEHSGTGTNRIVSSDDISIRSQNGDIILYPGSDSSWGGDGGSGKAYVGWGNDATSAGPENEIATVGTSQTFTNKTLGSTTTLGANLNANDNKIVGLTDPQDPQDAANKRYVDNAIAGLNWKQSVNLLSTTNFDISGDLVGEIIDGHDAFTTADNGYRILLTAQSTNSENGIYELLADGATLLASRPADANSYDELIGAAVFVMEGTQYENTSWVQSNHYLSDFAGQSWTQFSGTGTMIAGDGIAIDGLEVSVVGSDSITSSPTGIAVELATDSGLEIKPTDGLAVKVGYGLTVTGDTVYNDAVITVAGTTDQVSVSSASGDVTISLPQNIDSSADVDFGTLTLTGALTATAINLNNSRVGSANGTAGTSATIVDSFLVSEYTSGKYVVQLKHNNDIEVIEILLTVDGNNNVYLTEYADVISNYQLGTTDAAFDSGTVNLLVTAVNAGTSVKIHKTLIEA